MTILFWLAIWLIAVYLLSRTRFGLRAWTVGVGVLLIVATALGLARGIPGVVAWAAYALLLVPLNIDILRRNALSEPMMRRIRAMLPPMSQTERDAIEAGTVGWDAELFSGHPDWNRLFATPASSLSADEQAFIDGPVDELCAMLDDWQITAERNDLPPEVWTFLKRNRFFGMIIPKAYGGLGFSARAHSDVVMKVSARSGTAAVTVMVPNSLGPAELLLHYGTEAQKNHYLPRLARGEEIPCFALTGPTAGSDAASMPDYGLVCKGEHDGREVLGMRVTWEKRYITLGPVATVLGLAFRVYDPDHLLGEQEDLGITCALIPTSTPGVEIGDRHYPLNAAFQNGPNRGQDVFVPMDWVIGGREQIGNGWRMLMDSLSAGRGISLPSLGAGAGKYAAMTSGAYAAVRRQFNVAIGKFEGIEEPLARIGGLAYAMDAARLLTVAVLDAGEKPSVISAIMKYNNTEGMRQVLNDAMDIHGGRGISMGPRNYLARAYQQIPISITVEGANILTRSLIIFGQGAMRCHPYLLKEIETATAGNVAAFDTALWGHIGHVIHNKARAFVFGISNLFADSPVRGPTAGYYRAVERYSAAFAFLADNAFLLQGGELKRREKLSGRFADALGQLFYVTAVLKRFEDTGRPADDLPLVHWAARDGLLKIESALDGILDNFPMRWYGRLLRIVVFPLGRRQRRPDDRLGHQVANLLQKPGSARDRLLAGLYVSTDPNDVTGRLENAYRLVMDAAAAEHALREAGHRPRTRLGADDGLDEFVAKGVVTAAQVEQVRAARAAVADVVQVDAFAPDTSAAAASAARDEAA
ncbi:MAG: acyl-CoA dehydrogenase [Chromatiales bacterium]|nr:acyl-CoA dehydrogenase [Chromatiales bacterium]